MCTIIVLNDCVPGYSLIVAANRDERYDRPSSPPTARRLGDLDVIVPWDDKRDGTWIGVARGGWFVGLTNQDDGKHDDHALSRGRVVVDCLCAGTHTSAAKVIAHLDPAHYNPFNIVFGRPGALFLTRVMPGQPLEMQPLLDDVHVISNDCWAGAYDMKTEWGKRFIKSMIHDPPITDINQVLSRLMLTLSSHRNATPEDPFQALCVHAEEHSFGTVSTSIITVSNEGVVEYFYSEGHPCSMSAPFQKVGTLERIDA